MELWEAKTSTLGWGFATPGQSGGAEATAAPPRILLFKQRTSIRGGACSWNSQALPPRVPEAYR
jgi:hypothetical protein